MNRCLTIAMLCALASTVGVAFAQTYHLTEYALTSAGGKESGGAYILSASAGLAVTGVDEGPASSPLYAEDLGFWRWGHLPVLGVNDPSGPAEVTHFALSPSIPNPSSRQTTIRYAIPSSAGVITVSLKLYDLTGRMMRDLDSGSRTPGVHTVMWDGRDTDGALVRGGIYFYRIVAGHFTASRRLALVR